MNPGAGNVTFGSGSMTQETFVELWDAMNLEKVTGDKSIDVSCITDFGGDEALKEAIIAKAGASGRTLDLSGVTFTHN